MVHVNEQSKLPYGLLRFDLISAAFAFFRDFFLSSGIAQKILCYILCYFLKNSEFGRSPEFREQGTALKERGEDTVHWCGTGKERGVALVKRGSRTQDTGVALAQRGVRRSTLV